jgi:hypothetical protein
MKNLTYGMVSLAALCAVLMVTPLGVTAQQTIREMTTTEASDSALLVSSLAIEAATEGAQVSLDAIEGNLSADAVDGNDALATGPQLKGKFDDVTPDTVAEGKTSSLRSSNKGDLYMYLRDAAGNERGANVNASGQLAIAGPVTNAGTFAVQVDGSALTAAQTTATSMGAATQHYRTSAGSTEDEFEVKATAGVLVGGIITNTAATVSYLKCSNLTAANTTPGTSAVFFAAAIPGASTGAGFALPIPPGGVTFSTALTCYLVKGAADTDVAEVGANEVKVNLFFR